MAGLVAPVCVFVMDGWLDILVPELGMCACNLDHLFLDYTWWVFPLFIMQFCFIKYIFAIEIALGFNGQIENFASLIFIKHSCNLAGSCFFWEGGTICSVHIYTSIHWQ